MLSFLPALIRIPLIALSVAVSTIAHVTVLLLVAVIKALAPISRFRRGCDLVLISIAESWIGVNSALIGLFTDTRFTVRGLEGLDPRASYLVLSNHHSWVDIPVLQKAFNRRIPFMRFFLKQQLIWVPVLGLAWWALDFPFMRRHSREEIAANPDLARRDIEATRKACARFRGIPVSVMNFVEGTRLTPEKLAGQGAGFRHLLRPKAGGAAFVLGAMAGALDSILDVTVVYPRGASSLWDFLSNRLPEVVIDVRQLPLPEALLDGDYENDAAFRERFQTWINGVWRDKDERIRRILESHSEY